MHFHCECCGTECDELYAILDLDDPRLQLTMLVCLVCADFILEADAQPIAA